MKFDIRTVENTVVGRNLWAYICNSGEYPIFKVNFTDHEDGTQTFDITDNGAKVMFTSGFSRHELPVDSSLELYEDEYKFCSWGCGITSSFGFGDMYNLVKESRYPHIRKDSIIGIAEIYYTPNPFDNHIDLKLFKVGKVDPHCQVVAKLIPLTEDEMKEIKTLAKDWLAS